MALTGLQIQKLLPKTNCKECGSSTCLAFAMRLAAKKAELSECPYVSEEARAVLSAFSEPPIRTVTIGPEARPLATGGETVLFRHEKTFVNQTGIGVAVADTLEGSELEQRLKAFRAYRFERAGETLRPDLVSVAYESGTVDRLLMTLERVAALWDRSIAVRSDDATALQAAAAKLRGRRIVLASATPATIDQLGAVAKETGSALAVAADHFNDLYTAVEKLRQNDFKEIFLELRADSLCEHYQNRALLRRAALKSGIKALGYPTIQFINTGNPVDDAIAAGMEVTRYGSLVVLPDFDPAAWVSLLALRQNIYTDPQKPIQVEPKVYSVGEPTERSPVFVTTNFSLTYFIVSGEIENAGLSAWLAIPECEGMSVLTAWAAGKFSGAKIGSFVKESGLEQQTKNRTIVIPGYVAQVSGELEEALPGWQVIVGPQEAGDIEGFVKNVLKS
ncbi:MAG: acetyl-CoA decarbonylase/synthase complex subunit gamma [Acidobacteria bacterium]|nr:acetyl-CoA decarbonylase/synthase complex subunit gamma [Acidobacteriota bacterium]MBI3657157.1 acetyl-CoA decarbonylase/synthase complex subunit gamma [Acidobacteriota bacterium]